MVYADASALVKLVIEEEESGPLMELIGGEQVPASSIVSAVEVPRAVRRAGEPHDAIENARRLVDALELLTLDDEVVSRTWAIYPSVRSLDAIHLASALTLGSELDAFAAYDRRLQRAARDLGLHVVAPGS